MQFTVSCAKDPPKADDAQTVATCLLTGQPHPYHDTHLHPQSIKTYFSPGLIHNRIFNAIALGRAG